MKKRQFNGNERLYLHEVLYSGLLSSRYGDMAHRFEQAFVDKFDVPYAIAVNSGTSALFVALKACGVGPGDEVIVPCLGPTPTAAAVVHAGATPIFADIDPETYCITENTVEAVVSEKTVAVIPVHIFGNKCIYESYDFFVIEDCAQAVTIGGDGDVSCYSFEQSKHICCGDGGMVTTNDPEVADEIRKWSDHGVLSISPFDGRWQKGHAKYDFPGYNFRMSELVAAVGLAQMETAEGGILYRTEHVTDNPDEYEAYLIGTCVEYGRAPWGRLVYQHEMFGAQKGLCPVAEELHPNLFIFPTR